MILPAKPFHLYYIKRLSVKSEEDCAFSCKYSHSFFRSLYNRLSRLFAIALLFSFSPIYVCSFLPYRVIALTSEIPPFADCSKPTDKYLQARIIHHAYSSTSCRFVPISLTDEDEQLVGMSLFECLVLCETHVRILKTVYYNDVWTLVLAEACR